MKDDLESLRTKNAALNEQIKLLVKTEQSLFRSRRYIDQQLERVLALSKFAPGCTLESKPNEILEGALQVITNAFSTSRAAAIITEPSYFALVVFDNGQFDAERCFQNETCKREAIRSAEAFSKTQLISKNSEAVKPMVRFLDRIAPKHDGGKADEIVVVPLHLTNNGINGFLLFEIAPPNFYAPRLSEKDMPFIRLLGTHVERALQNIALMREANQRHEELRLGIKKLEETQSQLAQAAKMETVGRLAGGVAHDFNNFLTVILTHASLIKDEPLHTINLGDVDRIIDASKRATLLVRRLLAFSRREEGKTLTRDLNQVVNETSHMLGSLIDEDVRLHLNLAPALGSVSAGAGEIEQIIINLVVNAGAAISDGGEITIKTDAAELTAADAQDMGTEPGEYLMLSVIDNGSGMDEKTKNRIFEPFFTTKGVGKGTGMGLSTIFGIVGRLGGITQVSSTEGEGSEFRVFLPKATEQAIKSTDALDNSSMQGGKETILLVEDEESIRLVALRILRKAGYKVLTACTPIEAIEISDRYARDFDLVVTDVVMPKMNGINLVAELRKTRHPLRVLFMSGHTMDALDVRGFDKNSVQFLWKPFSPKQLLMEVRKAITSDDVEPLNRNTQQKVSGDAICN